MATKKFNQPLSGDEMVRTGGIATMMRLPVHKDATGLDACFVGIPIDSGTLYKSGCRLGPRYIRMESTLIRKFNGSTGAKPYDSLQVADLGDINFNPVNLPDAIKVIRGRIADIIKDGCVPLIMGGDRSVSYPALQAMKEKYGKVGMIHIDAHVDTSGPVHGSRIHHASPFRCALEEELLDTNRVVQIGIRGSCETEEEYDLARASGFRMIFAEDCWYKSLAPLMEEVRALMGDQPVYISFDIDALDPAYAPGTGAPELGGLTSTQALEIIRGCRGLNLVGCDIAEVAPQYDPSGRTALHAANLLFEMLCVLPGVKYNERPRTKER